MGSSLLKVLKPLVINEWDEPQRVARIMALSPTWDQVRAWDGPEFKHLIQTIYFAVLDYYINHRKPIPLAVLNRSYTKSLNSLAKRSNIGLLKITEFLTMIHLSETAPIGMSNMASGAIGLLPFIASQTVVSRGMRGEPTCGILDLVSGHVEGPELSPAGMKLAYAPFDELELPAQNLVSADKPAESFPVLQDGGTND